MSPAPPGVAVAGPDPGLPAPVPDDGRALLAELGHLPSQSGAPEQHPPSLAGDGRKQQVNISINMGLLYSSDRNQSFCYLQEIIDSTFLPTFMLREHSHMTSDFWVGR